MKTILLLLISAFSLLSSDAFAQSKKLKVFILAGQSNMQGHAKISTFEHIGMDPATKPMLAEMLGADGKPKVCERVWISSIGCGKDPQEEQTGKLTAGFGASPEKIGPEFTFGIYMEKLTDAPILLIKTSWGGKSLNTDFRSPSAGPYVFNETQLANFQKQGKDVAAMNAEKAKATGVYYRLMIEHVKKCSPTRSAWCPPTTQHRATKSRASRGSKAGTTWWMAAPIRIATRPAATMPTPRQWRISSAMCGRI